MPRWRQGGYERLEEAALELFAEQGYDATSVGQIAARAGLTQRTFYNHFPDKREVLFGLSVQFEAETVTAFNGCAGTLPPLDAVVCALTIASESMFEHRRSALARRLSIIGANRELQERDLTKHAALTDVLADLLCRSGLDAETAVLTASAGLLVQRTAISAWTRPAEGRPLREFMSQVVRSLRIAVDQHSLDSDAAPHP